MSLDDTMAGISIAYQIFSCRFLSLGIVSNSFCCDQKKKEAQENLSLIVAS